MNFGFNNTEYPKEKFEPRKNIEDKQKKGNENESKLNKVGGNLTVKISYLIGFVLVIYQLSHFSHIAWFIPLKTI